MKNVVVGITLPDQRESGGPMESDELLGTEIAMSADGGENYGVLDTVPPIADPQELLIPDLEAGDWYIRAVWIDLDGRRSAEVIEIAAIPDETPPGTGSITLTIS